MLAHSIPFSSDHAADFFAQFPAAPAVFSFRGVDESAEPYVSKTTNLRKRLQRLLAPPESQSKRLNLRERTATIEYSLTGSDFESVLLLYQTLRQEFPDTYQKRLRLRPAPVVRFNLENEYPRAYVTTRIGKMSGRSLYYGPFRSRALADKFLNDSLDLFKMRRCTFDLNPDPSFPGCVYSEMKMCLAPCFKGCTDEAYAAEVARVQEYFDSGGHSLLRELEAERERLRLSWILRPPQRSTPKSLRSKAFFPRATISADVWTDSTRSSFSLRPKRSPFHCFASMAASCWVRTSSNGIGRHGIRNH